MATDYLKQYDEAAEKDKYPLIRGWMFSEPLELFKELREKRPILVTPECTLLALFDDVTETLNMPKIFTNELYIAKMQDYLMAHDDDALHTREKSIMMGFLNRDDLPFVRTMVGDIGQKILDNAGGRIDIVNDYCRMVPATLVQDYFGLNGIERKELIDWSYWCQYNTFHNQPFDLNPKELDDKITTNQHAAIKKLEGYIGKLILRRLPLIKLELFLHSLIEPLLVIKKLLGPKDAPTPPYRLEDDIVARMMRSPFAKGVEFDVKRLGINAGGLLIGAVETTSQAVAQVFEFLFERPDLLAKAVDAAKQEDTTLFDGIVWEALRFVPISPYMFRMTASEYTVAKGTERETTIQPGTIILPLIQSAMFDPKAFESPDEFKPDRNWYHYFHFGFGSHECLGKYVGMVMIPEMVRQVLLKSDIKANGGIDYKSGPFPEYYELIWGS